MVGMSESGIRNLIRRGTLRAVRLDGRWLIPATAIEDKLGVQLDANIAPTPRPTLPTPLRREAGRCRQHRPGPCIKELAP